MKTKIVFTFFFSLEILLRSLNHLFPQRDSHSETGNHKRALPERITSCSVLLNVHTPIQKKEEEMFPSFPISVRDGQGNGSGVAGALHSLLQWWLAIWTGRCFYLSLWHLDGQQSSETQRKEFTFNEEKKRSPLQTFWLCTALLLSESLVRWYHRWPFPVGTDKDSKDSWQRQEHPTSARFRNAYQSDRRKCSN